MAFFGVLGLRYEDPMVLLAWEQYANDLSRLSIRVPTYSQKISRRGNPDEMNLIQVFKENRLSKRIQCVDP